MVAKKRGGYEWSRPQIHFKRLWFHLLWVQGLGVSISMQEAANSMQEQRTGQLHHQLALYSQANNLSLTYCPYL